MPPPPIPPVINYQFTPFECDLFHHQGETVDVTCALFNHGNKFTTPADVDLIGDIFVVNAPNSTRCNYSVLSRGQNVRITFEVDSLYNHIMRVSVSGGDDYHPTQHPAKWDAPSYNSYYYGYLIHPSATTWGGPWHIQGDLTPRIVGSQRLCKAQRAWRTTPKAVRA